MNGARALCFERSLDMNAAYLSALSALAGSVIGGMISGVTTWLSQRSQARAAELTREMSRRDELYADFIVAASKAYGEIHKPPQLNVLRRTAERVPSCIGGKIP